MSSPNGVDIIESEEDYSDFSDLSTGQDEADNQNSVAPVKTLTRTSNFRGDDPSSAPSLGEEDGDSSEDDGELSGGIEDSAIVEEEYDSGYEPAQDEIEEYAEFLGMDLAAHKVALSVSSRMLK